MKRWMFSISLCLFLGVLTTVGVACALAWFVDMTWMEPQIEVFPLPDTRGRTNRAEYQQLLVADGAFRVAWHEGVQRNQVFLGFSLHPSYDSRSQPLEMPDARGLSWCFRDTVPTDSIMHVSDARGWPMLALCAGFDLVPAGGGCRDVSRRYWAVAVMEPDEMRWLFPSVDYKQRLIPVRPILGGFLINTLFYAAILWLLALGPFTARRMIRRNRGLCINCGYDLRGDLSSGCPECGWRREDVS